jgi:hypothetical protein
VTSFNPLDPFGMLEAAKQAQTDQINAVKRMTAQRREAERQARLTATKADVVTAYTAWLNQPDGPASTNLQEAITTYLSILGS